jgi:hypothetical protein
MPSRSISRKSQPALASAIARHAVDIAAAGDRSFVSLAGGLYRVGSWVCAEMNHAAGSAAGAVATTVDAAKRLAGSSWARRAHACRADTGDSDGPGLCGERCGPQNSRNCTRHVQEEDSGESVGKRRRGSEFDRLGETPMPRSPSRRSRGGVDLLSAVPVSAWCGEQFPDSEAVAESTRTAPPAVAPESDGVPTSGSPDKRAAGVLPVLQALGRTVADHVHQGYASLETDERFWTLVRLLEALARPNGGTSDAQCDVVGSQLSEAAAASASPLSKTSKPETELRWAAAARCEPES